MQTFLPYKSFESSAEILDYKRLGKQRLEAKQLVNSIELLDKFPGSKVGWPNHPARRMWVGYTDALKLYCNVMIQEWIKRGYTNTMQCYEIPSNIMMPPWLGYELLHKSHRANLLRKDPEYYNIFKDEDPTTPYYWPV
jgi:hypothetical protein